MRSKAVKDAAPGKLMPPIIYVAEKTQYRLNLLRPASFREKAVTQF
jgi:hypothetical protein